MTILIDNSKAVEISIREWDEENTQYGLDWSADFYDVGRLKTVDGPELAYIVEDVDYCIEQANDMVAGEGDFAEDGPQPDTFVDVTELDRSAYLICEIDLYQLSSEIYNHGLNVKDTESYPACVPRTLSRWFSWMVRHAVWVSILIPLFASTSRIMRMKAAVMVSFRRVAMISRASWIISPV